MSHQKMNYCRIVNSHPGNIKYLLQKSNVVVDMKAMAKRLKKQDNEKSLMQCQEEIVKKFGYKNLLAFYGTIMKAINIHIASSKNVILDLDEKIRERTFNLGKDCYGLKNLISFDNLNSHVQIIKNELQEKSFIAQAIENDINLFIVNNDNAEFSLEGIDTTKFNIVRINSFNENECETEYEISIKSQIEQVLSEQGIKFNRSVRLSKNKPTKLIDFFNEKMIIVINTKNDEQLKEVTNSLIDWILRKKFNSKPEKGYKQDIYLFKENDKINENLLLKGRSVCSSCIVFDKINVQKDNDLTSFNTKYKLYPYLSEGSREELIKEHNIVQKTVHERHNTLLITGGKLTSLWK